MKYKGCKSVSTLGMDIISTQNTVTLPEQHNHTSMNQTALHIRVPIPPTATIHYSKWPHCTTHEKTKLKPIKKGRKKKKVTQNRIVLVNKRLLFCYCTANNSPGVLYVLKG